MISLRQVVMVGVFLTIILMLLATLLFLLCRRKLCPPCPCPQTPDKPVKQNNHEVATEKVFTFFFKISLSLSTVCFSLFTFTFPLHSHFRKSITSRMSTT